MTAPQTNNCPGTDTRIERWRSDFCTFLLLFLKVSQTWRFLILLFLGRALSLFLSPYSPTSWSSILKTRDTFWRGHAESFGIIQHPRKSRNQGKTLNTVPSKSQRDSRTKVSPPPSPLLWSGETSWFGESRNTFSWLHPELHLQWQWAKLNWMLVGFELAAEWIYLFREFPKALP